MTLARFTRANGEVLYINPDMVIACYPSNMTDASTTIACRDDCTYVVKEDLKSVAFTLRHSDEHNAR